MSLLWDARHKGGTGNARYNFLHFIQERDNFCDVLFHPANKPPSEKGSNSITLKGANSFLVEQTSFQKGRKTSFKELLPLKVYPFSICYLFFPKCLNTLFKVSDWYGKPIKF